MSGPKIVKFIKVSSLENFMLYSKGVDTVSKGGELCDNCEQSAQKNLLLKSLFPAIISQFCTFWLSNYH